MEVEGDDPAPLVSPSEATPGVLCPFLGFPGHERHGAPGAGPAEGDKEDKGDWSIFHEQKLRELGLVQPQEETSERGSHPCL